MRRSLCKAALCLIAASSFLGCGKVEFSQVKKTEIKKATTQNKTENLQVTQGHTNRDVDILIVVDNSISMLQEQKKLGQKFGDVISALGDTDWRIGFFWAWIWRTFT